MFFPGQEKKKENSKLGQCVFLEADLQCRGLLLLSPSSASFCLIVFLLFVNSRWDCQGEQKQMHLYV